MKTRNYSKKREVILAKIRSTKTHPTAEWVYRELKDEIPDLSLGTVYRNIGVFKEDGEMISVCTVNGQERFDANTMPHSHFVCTACNAVIDFDGFDKHSKPKNHLKQMGFKVNRMELIAYGLCDKCNEI